MTQKGRVVYDRKKDLFKPKDIARILSSYTQGATGAQFAKFCRSVLELSLKRAPESPDFISQFWSYFINFLVPQLKFYDWRDLLGEARAMLTGGVGVGTQVRAPPPEPLTPAEKKRKKQRGGL